MARLSITTAWNETTAFVKREGRLLFPIALLLLALPGVLAQLLVPEQQAQAAAGQPPELGAWMLLMPITLALSMIGNIAISYLALRSGRSVGEALGRGGRRFLPLLGSAILILLAGAVVIFLISMVVALLMPGAVEGIRPGVPPPPEAMAAIGLIVLLGAPVFVFFAVRLLMLTPVAAAEDVGPIALIRRSWRLTSGMFWKLLGFILMIGLLYLVVLLVVQIIGGLLLRLVAGPPDPGSLSLFLLSLLGGLVGAVLSVFVVTVIARIYAQLSGDNMADVF